MTSRSIRIVAIGDPHFQTSNINIAKALSTKLVKLCQDKQPDFIVLLGDLLHTHETVHVEPMNEAYNLVKKLSEIAHTFVLVGNHDMMNNHQFLTTNHWMNGMKDWNNVTVVDNVITHEFNGRKFTMCPYVFVGRFKEALNTLESDWNDSTCIFAHQEMYGVKMGHVESKDGDGWSPDLPMLISGHIHATQWVSDNLYYPGSAMQHTFGEDENNVIPIIDIDENNQINITNIDLELPVKKTIIVDMDDIKTLEIPEEPDNQFRVIVNGDYSQFSSIKKTKKYKSLLNQGVKVVFKQDQSLVKQLNDEENNIEDELDIIKIITEKLDKSDMYVLNLWKEINSL